MTFLPALVLMFNCLHIDADLNATQTPQQTVESAQVSISKLNPFIGEQVELTLTIRTSQKGILELHIPWLSELEAWSVRWQFWLRPMPKTKVPGLLLRFRDVLVIASPVRPGEYQLRWKMVISDPGTMETETRVLSPIQVGKIQTNALHLQSQRLPARPVSAGSWNLGVGVYRVAAQWSDQSVVLGEETTLMLSVEGSGALELVPSPPWRTAPGWESDRFMLEAGPDQWEIARRFYPIRVRPRQLRAVLSPLLVNYFDPQREQWVSQQVPVPPLKILAARQSALLPGSTVNDALIHLPDFQRSSLDQHAALSWAAWGSWLMIVPVAGVFVIVIQQCVASLAPGWLESRRWRKATRQAQRLLNTKSFSVNALRQALQDYFSIGLDRTISDDLESFHRLALLSPRLHQLSPVLEQLQLCEFGPANEQNMERLRKYAHQFVQSNRETS